MQSAGVFACFICQKPDTTTVSQTQDVIQGIGQKSNGRAEKWKRTQGDNLQRNKSRHQLLFLGMEEQQICCQIPGAGLAGSVEEGSQQWAHRLKWGLKLQRSIPASPFLVPSSFLPVPPKSEFRNQRSTETGKCISPPYRAGLRRTNLESKNKHMLCSNQQCGGK